MNNAWPSVALYVALALVSGCEAEGREPPDGKGPAADTHAQLQRQADGSVVLELDDDAVARLAVEVSELRPGSLSPESEAYGRVLDPEPFLSLVAQEHAASAALDAASQELVRSRLLAARENASARAVETATVAEAQMRAAFDQSHAQLLLGWAELFMRKDLSEIMTALVARDAVLVRVDAPSHLVVAPRAVRFEFVDLPGESIAAELVGRAPNVDEKLQGRAFLALVRPNTAQLMPGTFLTAHLELAGDSEPGVLVARSAVVRAEGKAWIYLQQADRHRFQRVEVSLDLATPSGWLVTHGPEPGSRVIVVGAQQLLSEEARARGQARD